MNYSAPKTQLNEGRDFAIEADIAFQMVRSILGGERALYASGPLDSGPRLYRFMQKLGVTHTNQLVASIGSEEYYRRIREQNQCELSAFCDQLRKRTGKSVIDPGILKVPAWDGSHYSFLFLEIVRMFISELWFLDGWEYSSGATKEFAAALSWGLPCYSMHGARIDAASGFNLISSAVYWIESQGMNASKLNERLTLLSSPL